MIITGVKIMENFDAWNHNPGDTATIGDEEWFMQDSTQYSDTEFSECIGLDLHDFKGKRLGRITGISRIGELDDILSVDLDKNSVHLTMILTEKEISKIGSFVILNTEN
jgi:hypothetical protein